MLLYQYRRNLHEGFSADIGCMFCSYMWTFLCSWASFNHKWILYSWVLKPKYFLNFYEVSSSDTSNSRAGDCQATKAAATLSFSFLYQLDSSKSVQTSWSELAEGHRGHYAVLKRAGDCVSSFQFCLFMAAAVSEPSAVAYCSCPLSQQPVESHMPAEASYAQRPGDPVVNVSFLNWKRLWDILPGFLHSTHQHISLQRDE